MKKFYLLFLIAFIGMHLYAQNPNERIKTEKSVAVGDIPVNDYSGSFQGITTSFKTKQIHSTKNDRLRDDRHAK